MSGVKIIDNLKICNLKAFLTSIKSQMSPASILESNSLKTANKTCNLVALINNSSTNQETAVEIYVLYAHVVAVQNILISKSIKVSQVFFTSNLGIYERFGKYVKTMGSGLQYFNPFTDTIHVVDMKTTIINLHKQKALTKDNI